MTVSGATAVEHYIFLPRHSAIDIHRAAAAAAMLIRSRIQSLVNIASTNILLLIHIVISTDTCGRGRK